MADLLLDCRRILLFFWLLSCMQRLGTVLTASSDDELEVRRTELFKHCDFVVKFEASGSLCCQYLSAYKAVHPGALRPTFMSAERERRRPTCQSSCCQLMRAVSVTMLLVVMAGDVQINPGPLHVGSLNCRSAVSKTALIHDLICDYRLDVLLLSETWFTTDTPQSMLLDVAPPGYAALHVVRQTGAGRPTRGGGLAALFNESLPVRVHPLASKIQSSTFELQLLRVSAAPSPFTVVHVYRPQWLSSVSSFVDELADIIAVLSSECTDNIIVCGDMNCPGETETSVDSDLSECFASLGLDQLVKEPTRCLPGVSNLLDVFATSDTTLVDNVSVTSADYLSDHCMITADVEVRAPKPVITYTSRNIRAVDAAKFEDDLRNSVLFTRPAGTVDGYVDQLNDVLLQLLDNAAPARTRRRRPQKRITRWLSVDAVDAKRTRRRLERRWRTTGDESDRLQYRRSCRRANQLINESRTCHYRQRFQDAGCDHKKRWRIVGELLHSHDSDKTRTDTENRALCDTFSAYFIDKIVKLRDNVSDTLRSLQSTLPSYLSFPPYHGPVIDRLPPVTTEEVRKVLNSCPHKSSAMDTVPTSLLVRCQSTFSEIITNLANLSFTTGVFPAKFKQASVTPLIKGHSLDKSVPANYRPISNLNFISKVLERLFLARFQAHIVASPNFNYYQSAYRSGCSTESALQLLLDRIFSDSDDGRPTLLVSLDLSAAFDMIDHTILLKRLGCSFGVTGTVHSWVHSYLQGRTQSVRIGTHSSAVTPCSIGVPQGSVLGPLLFSIYTSPISTIADSHQVSQQQYADDTQLYIALSPSDLSNITNLQSCLASLHVWFCENGMALNPIKSDAILFGTPQRLKALAAVSSVTVAGTDISIADSLKILGVTLDANLTFALQSKNISRSCFYHIRAFRHVRPSLDDATAVSVALSLVSTRLDYANSTLYGCPKKHIARLQRAQNALARVVLQQRFHYPTVASLDLLKQLHWLPIEWRIKFKIALLTYKALHTGSPPYLSDLLHRHTPVRSTRSASSQLLQVPRHSLLFGSRAFRISAPKVWNSLPHNIRESNTSSTFRRNLKTHFFSSAFVVP